jgi:hypothetical protein
MSPDLIEDVAIGEDAVRPFLFGVLHLTGWFTVIASYSVLRASQMMNQL